MLRTQVEELTSKDEELKTETDNLALKNKELQKQVQEVKEASK
jgi:hypothetical protein